MMDKRQTAVHLGFVIPAEHHNRQRRSTLVAELNHALDAAAGYFESAWMVDHLQFGDIDVLENFTALSYLSALHPRPDPIPPIMVGAFKPKMLRLAAKHADWWNVSSTGPVSYRSMVEAFNGFCIEAGRAPLSVRRSWIGGCACAPTYQEAVDLAGDRWSADDDEDFGFLGTPDQVLEQMKTFFDMGVDTFMFDCAGFPGSTTLRTLISDVIPGLPQFIDSKNS